MRNAWKSLSETLKSLLSRPVLRGEFRSGEILFANRNSLLEIFLSGVGAVYVAVSRTAGNTRATTRYLRTFRALSPDFEKLVFDVPVGQEAWVRAVSLGGFVSKAFIEHPTVSIKGELTPGVHPIEVNVVTNPNATFTASGRATLQKNPRSFCITTSQIDSLGSGRRKFSLTVKTVVLDTQPIILSTTRILCRSELPKVEISQFRPKVLRPSYRIASILMD